MAVYTLAFFAHIAEWIFGSRSKVGRTAAALTRAAGAAAEGATAPARSPSRSRQGRRHRPSWSGRRSSPAPRPARATCRTAPAPHGGDEQGDLYGPDRRLPDRPRLPHRGGRCRHPRACRCSARRGATCTSSASPSPRSPSACTSACWLLRKKNVRWLGLPLVTTVLLDLGLAVTVLYTASDQLVPALHSYWLWIHVSTAIFCGAVFYVGAVATLLYLFRDRYETKLVARREDRRLRDLRPGAAARRRDPRQARLPRQRGRLPAVDVHDHRGRDLGRQRLGPLLGLGPEGDLVVHHLGRLRLLPARARHGRLEGPQGGVPGADRLRAASSSTTTASTSSSPASTRTRASDPVLRSTGVCPGRNPAGAHPCGHAGGDGEAASPALRGVSGAAVSPAPAAAPSGPSSAASAWAASPPPAGLRELLGRVRRQLRRLGRRGAEAEGRGEVAERTAAPLADVGLLDARHALQEPQDRGVVEGLAGRPAAHGPRRDDDARHAEPAADRQPVDELVRGAGLRRRRDDVVEQAVVLVVVEDERGLAPTPPGWTRWPRSSRRRSPRRPPAGSPGARTGAGADDPGDRRQPVVAGVVLERARGPGWTPLSYSGSPGFAFLKLANFSSMLQP